MIAAFTFNTSILLALVLIPLICPEALPPQAMAFLMEAPAPPPAPAPPRQPSAQTTTSTTRMQFDPFAAPSVIPRIILVPSEPEPPLMSSADGQGPGVIGSTGDPFPSQPVPRVVRPEPRTTLRVSSTMEEGLLIDKRVPVYPAIAKAAGVGGTVRLAATISKTGTIENLRVIGGPPLLQQAALDAVKTWRYRAYLLDGQPVEVETTVDVIFSLSR
jgi:protein TonB